MSPGRQGLCLRLGLGLLAFSSLLFFTRLEDAYELPQRLGLALGTLALLAGLWDRPLPSSTVFWLGLSYFAWRFFCHFCSPDAPPDAPWLSAQIPLLALFLAASAALRDGGLRKRAAFALLAAGALGSVYALLAPLGWDPFSAGALDLGFGRRAHGTLGNPDFLGGWLAMLLPLALVCAERAQGKARTWAKIAAGLMLLALLTTFARGAWAAACGGMLASLALLRARPHWRGLIPWMALCAVLAGIILALGSGWKGVSDRLDELADIHSDAWGSRVFMGSVALDLAREHPITGVGGGAFEMEYLRRQGERLWSESSQPFRLTADAHNDWAQAAAETGFPGLLLWVLLFALALRAAAQRGGPEGAAVAGVLAAFGIQGCFHFPWDIVPSAGLVLLALAAAAGFDGVEIHGRARGWPLWAGLAVLACLGLDLRQAEASALLNSGTALQSSAVGMPLSGALLGASADLAPDDERAWSRLAVAQMAQSQNAAAVLSYQRALQDLPSSFGDWTNLGLCLGLQGDMKGAAAALKQAVQLNPRSNEAWSDEAKAQYLLGDKDQAMALARQGIAEAGGSAQAWFNLGALLFNAGETAQAAEAFEACLRLDPGYPQAADLLKACGHAR
ncbi:MAG TPA: O-antigen ligase family protein [bacterium]|jgi:tetratricopeptide (TPR) repeat protein|nr:O-antigen ligase family protein [bacterium]